MTKAKAKPKFNRDDPVRWKIWDAWNNARYYAALQDYWNIREDGKVGVAFLANDLDYVRKITKKRLKAVGVTKPKFKKQKKVGQAAMDEPGTRAHALRLYERKIFGTPKPLPKLKKARKKEGLAKKAVNKKKAPHVNPASPNSDLPQTDAYTKARKKAKKNEIVLYITHRGEDRYTATYLNEKTKKKRNLHITGEFIPHIVPAALPPKPMIRKAVREKDDDSKPKKAKKNKGTSRY